MAGPRLIMAAATLALLPLAGAAPLRAQSLVTAAAAATAATPAASPARLEALLAECYLLLRHDMALAIERSTTAAELAARLDSPTGRARALALQAIALAQRDGSRRARDTLAAAEALLDGATDTPAAAEVGLCAAAVLWSYDELARCFERLRQAMDIADTCGDERLQLRSQILAMSLLGPAEDPLPELDRLEALSQQLGDRLASLDIQSLRAHGGFGLPEGQSQLDALRNLQAAATAAGERGLTAVAALAIAGQLFPEQPAAAFPRLQEATAAATALGDHELLAIVRHHEAELLLHAHRLPEARQAIDAALLALGDLPMSARLRGLLETSVRVATNAGDTAVARRDGERQVALERQSVETASAQADLRRMATLLRRDLREQQRRQTAELAAANSRYANLWIGSVVAVLGLGSLLAVLLHRSKRRLETANARLSAEIATARTATEEREAMAQNLRQLERLDGLGLLAGGFAHDFNNLLVGVLGNANQLLEEPDQPPNHRRLLEQIRDTSQRAATLCRDILSYARHGNPRREALDLRDLLAGLVPIARAGFGAGVEVIVHGGNDAALVRGDRSQLEQVFLNVLVNAHDAIRERGRITVRLGSRRLDGTPPSGHWFGEFPGTPRDYVTVAVTDTGHGIEPDTIRRIFDPFFSTRFPGRGLGLAAAYGILRRHEGIVEVRSEPGHGSTFTIHLPVAPAATTTGSEPVVTIPPPPPASPTGSAARQRILVVDDEPSVRSVASRLLQRAGHTTLVAGTGAAALAAVASGPPPDAALLDYTMPDIDGAGLVAALREQFPALRIVVMSGHDEATIRAALPEVTFLPKPFDAASLAAALAVGLPAR